MDLVTSNFMPGDPRLIDQIVYELKSQGIFDQFRKECIADVDTKPAYQNLSQRVEGNVMNFLRKQRFSEDMNKNQLREQLRKNISESGFLETGVERIVDQVVNPKINSIFLPKVEDVVYRYLGIKKPNEEVEEDIKVNTEDLLPTDLEAISPESVTDHSLNITTDKKDDSIETNENSLNSSNTKTEDESPPFELLEENTKFSVHEENSIDSHLSGISGLAHDSQNVEVKTIPTVDMAQDISQNSLYSEGNLSIVTSEDDIKMEICEDSNLSDSKDLKADTNNTNKDNTDKYNDEAQKEEKTLITVEEKHKELVESTNGNDVKNEEIKKVESKKSEEKKSYENKNDSKRSHDKHKSSRSEKDRKEDKEKKSRSRSKSESKHKDHKDSKSSSKHNSSKEKDKDKERDKKEIKNDRKDKTDGTEKHKDKTDSIEKHRDKTDSIEKHKDVKKEDKDRDKSKDKSSKTKEKSEKDRDRTNKEKDKAIKIKNKEGLDKEKINKEKSGKAKIDKDKEKQKSEKEKGRSEKDKEIKSEKEKGSAERDKDKSDRDKIEKGKSNSSKHSKEKSSSSESKKSNKEKEKSKDQVSPNNKHKVSQSKDRDITKSSKDKDKSKSNSRDKDKEKEKRNSGDHKSRSADKHKKSEKDKTSHHERSISSKKDKDKKTTDDHYSLKDKKSERRSTDRDSNDGGSGKGTSRNGSFTDSFSQSIKGSSKGSSEVFSSGSGDSSNSDKVEKDLIEQKSEVAADPVKMEAVPVIKYMKPKFASNIHEAMKIMKIRKQLAKLERQNQLCLTQVEAVKNDQIETKDLLNLKELTVVLEKNTLIPTISVNNIEDKKIGQKTENKLKKDANLSTEVVVIKQSPVLKSQDLSMESFEALEARLAQEMSSIDYNMYGDEDGCEYSPIGFSPAKKRKMSNDTKPNLKKVLFNTSNDDNDKTEIELVVREEEKPMPEEVKTVDNEDVKMFIEDQQVEDDEDQPKLKPGKIKTVNDETVEMIIKDQQEEDDERTNKFINENSTKILKHNEDLILKEVENNQAIILNKSTEESNDIVENKELVKKIQKVPKENIQDKKEDADKKDMFSGMEGFKGFNTDERNVQEVIRFVQKVSQLENNYNTKKLYVIKENNMNSLKTKLESKVNCQNKGDAIRLKHGLSLEATLKEVTIMSSTIQDLLLHRNGNKMPITKVLVSFQGKEAEKNNAGQKELLDKTHIQKEETSQFINSKPGVLAQYSDDEEPCLYFDQSDCSSEKHLKVLNDRIKRLEKELREKSLQIKKATPVVRKNGRKRKAVNTDNNNSIASKLNPDPPKKRLLSDSKLNQSVGSLCNTNIATNHSFVLPLSPAESDKSEEHKKEEPLTVKTKRTGRVSNSKRYSSEDLYKPRPVLSCTRSRRRGAKLEQDKT